jgi:hypothetical protein
MAIWLGKGVKDGDQTERCVKMMIQHLKVAGLTRDYPQTVNSSQEQQQWQGSNDCDQA